MKPAWYILLVYVMPLALVLGAWFVVYKVSDNDCRAHGGHTVMLYGARGWSCEVAKP